MMQDVCIPAKREKSEKTAEPIYMHISVAVEDSSSTTTACSLNYMCPFCGHDFHLRAQK